MDDLINEEIKDITNIERKNKTQININDYFDSLLQFVTKTVNLFCNMKFTSGLKCLFELAVIGVILLMGGLIISEILASIIRNVFSFVPYQILDIIMPVVYGIIDLS